MFSLIITIISIALVAALALATLYYGGGAFNKGSADATASKVMLQGQQLLGAADMYYAKKNVWPTMQQLLDEEYLKSIPTAQAPAVIAEAVAAGATWSMPIAGEPVFLLSGAVDTDACAAVNKRGTLGKDGIPVKAYTGLNAQCYGSNGTYNVIFKKYATETSLDDSADGTIDIPATDVADTPLPTSDTGTEWSKLPTNTSGDSGSGGDLTENNGGNGLYLTRTVIDFGEVATGGWGRLDVMATNTTSEAISFIEAPWDQWAMGPYTGGTDGWSAMFSLEIPLGGNCDPLPAGQSCYMFAEFEPTADGAQNWTTTLHTTAGDFPLQFKGTAVASTGVFAADAVAEGEVGKTTLVSANIRAQGSDRRLVSWTFDVPGQASFAKAVNGDQYYYVGQPSAYTYNDMLSCEKKGWLGTSGDCSLAMKFTPTEAGTVSGTYTIVTEDTSGNQYTRTGQIRGSVIGADEPAVAEWVSDTFDGSGNLNGHTVGSYAWGNGEGGPNANYLVLNGGTVYSNRGSQYDTAAISTAMPTNDYSIEVNFNNQMTAAGSDAIVVYLRSREYTTWGIGGNYYAAVELQPHRSGGTTQIMMKKREDGTAWVDPVTVPLIATGAHTLRVEAVGTQGKVFLDGTAVLSFPLLAPTTGTNVGIGFYNVTAGVPLISATDFTVNALSTLTP